VTAISDPWSVAADIFDPAPNAYRFNPSLWVVERLHEFFWSKQRQIAESVRDNRLTAVPSCHGPGKSYTAARIASWWIDSHPANEAFVVSSAPTNDQVRAILWREIQRAHRQGHLPGYVTLDAQWKIDGELVGYGRKPADMPTGSEHDTVTAFQGIHSRYPLVIFDESSGIPRELWNAAQSLLTNEDARWLVIGNPDDPTSRFAQACAGAPEAGGMSTTGWNVIPISLFDTPNFTGEEVPHELRAYLPSQEWLDDFVLNVGAAGTNVYASKVLGHFPLDRGDGAIPWSWLQACRGEAATARIGDIRTPVELGVDVGASDNGDLTVVRERQGMRAGRRWQVQSSDPDVVVAKIVQAAKQSGAKTIKLDINGVGWALQTPLRKELPGVEIVPVMVSESATNGPNGEKYVNVRSALWWEVGRLLSQQRAWDLSEIDDRTIAELTEHKWWEDKTGRIVIEPKADVKKRLGRSPDDADALLMAFYVPTNVARELGVSDQRLSGRHAR